jgi:hypothetical protein
MRNRATAWVAALAAVSLVSGMLMVSASAHIGASHSPIDTDMPDLVSVEAVDDSAVNYCFDDGVVDFSAASDFSLSGYDADTVAVGDNGDPTPSEPNCLTIEFDIDRDVRNFTIGFIAEGAAESREGDESPAGAAALEGSTATGGEGTTVAPNLTDWDASSSDEIDYIFDEEIDCDRAEAGDPNTYGFYDEDAALFEGADVTDCDDDDGIVTVEFTTGDVDDAVRVYVDENHGTDENCEPDPDSVDGCTSIEAEGDETDDSPDLESVERTDEDEWTFTFDEDLDDTSCVFGLFHVYKEDGTEFSGTACDEDDDTVEVEFSTVAEDAADSEFPLAAAESDAVDDDDDANPSTVGDAAVSDSGEESGLTDAPDLEVATADEDDGLVTYFFDEPIDDDFAFDESDFLMVDQDGDTTTGDDIDDAEDDFVIVEFDSDDVADAIGAAVVDDAAADWFGDLSEPAAVGFAAAVTTTTTSSTASPTASTPPPPSVVRVGTTVSIRYDRKPARKAAFKGAVRSKVHKCETGRQVELHRRKTGVVGRDTSNAKGKWKVRYPRAQGKFFAEVLRKVFTRGDGATVICKSDSTVD